MTNSGPLPPRVRRRGDFRLAIPPEDAFGLFTAEGERLWVEGWEPRILSASATEPSSVFLTSHGGEETIWVVVDADREEGLLRYARVSPGRRAGTVEVRVHPDSGGTRVEVAYDLTALGADGEDALRSMDEAGFAEMLTQWKKMIEAAGLTNSRNPA